MINLEYRCFIWFYKLNSDQKPYAVLFVENWKKIKSYSKQSRTVKRDENCRLTFCFKFLRFSFDLLWFSFNFYHYHVTCYKRNRISSRKFAFLSNISNIFPQNFFLQCVVRIWNSLPGVVFQETSTYSI